MALCSCGIMFSVRPKILRNETCCYCRHSLAERPFDKEHVIGRSFVPKGTLHQAWNLIAFACKACNGAKSDLEDDLSLLTLQHCPRAGIDVGRDQLIERTLEKATRSFSRKTKKPVSESAEESSIELPLGPGGNYSFTFISPPQAEDERAFKLAYLQAVAFFYALTYDEVKRQGSFWPGAGFFPADCAARQDWGNPVQKWFMLKVAPWPLRLGVVTAQGFFKAAIRRHPEAALWSCAIEWNEGMRVVSLMGDEATARDAAVDMPPLFGVDDPAIRLENRVIRMRSEVPILEREDILFDF